MEIFCVFFKYFSRNKFQAIFVEKAGVLIECGGPGTKSSTTVGASPISEFHVILVQYEENLVIPETVSTSAKYPRHPPIPTIRDTLTVIFLGHL